MKKEDLFFKIICLFAAVLLIFVLACNLDTADPAGKDPGETEEPVEPEEPEEPIETGDYIIADHSVVDDYQNIPQQYIDIVKTWLVDAAGESHSEAYRTSMSGPASVEALDSRFQAATFTSTFPDATTAELRIGSHGWIGEGSFWTNVAARDQIKAMIADQEVAGNPINVIFQGWCWDFTRTPGPAGSGTNDYDPYYHCHWYGSSESGPEGDHIWGLDDSDFALTGNSVSLQTYLDAIDDYNNYFDQNRYAATAIFTTGPVDGNAYSGEQGYQRYIKHQRIREFVQEGNGRILFDYADILAYNDAGDRHMETWTWASSTYPYNSETFTFPAIHDDNVSPEQTGHIANAGALRIGKAMWWLLARMAGWDGN